MLVDVGAADLFSVKCRYSPRLAAEAAVFLGEISSLDLSVAPEAMEAADLYRTASRCLTASVLSSLFIAQPRDSCILCIYS